MTHIRSLTVQKLNKNTNICLRRDDGFIGESYELQSGIMRD